jgi:thiamine biosynthesis protein ThiS
LLFKGFTKGYTTVGVVLCGAFFFALKGPVPKNSLARVRSGKMITVNGISQETPGTSSLEEFLLSQGYNREMVAVGLNEQVVRRADYPRVILKDGDTVEIFNFVQGG